MVVLGTKALLCDFATPRKAIANAKPIKGLLWKKDSLREVPIDPSKPIEDSRLALNLRNVAVKTYFLPVEANVSYLIVAIGTAKVANQLLTGGIMDLTTEEPEPKAAEQTKTHRRGGPPKIPLAPPQGPALPAAAASIPMVVIKKVGTEFVNFPCPEEPKKRDELTALFSTFFM